MGKVPLPESQVQEITRALIYKFLSAADAISLDLGGLAHYFTGDDAAQRWDCLLDAANTASDIQRGYTAGLSMLGQRDDIPPAFQTIFRDAYLPYNDPPTLRDFLNIIDRFPTDSAEQIGDAYEHLLQYLGAQANAGQFRTPRHVIDFITGIIDPQPHESILDPACGTGGFLASAWQRAAAAAGDDYGYHQRTTLAGNLVGYDIAPDMVKLATVNLYLNHHQSPKIHVYDTLTSEERWNDYYDVILANPPFMTPKGGIKPHSRFRVPARRAEVLFVDYIASHLNERGRAGVIVPEGIIFQSQNAYRQLRRLLLDESLVAVVSLPGGVFNPYSGVKTSILILDKVLAPKTDYVAFFKVENDGYDLGAQRRPIAQDDLPAVAEEINEYLRRLRAGESLDDYQPRMGHVVEKSEIAADGEYNLSGERYKVEEPTSQKWPVAKIEDVCSIIKGQAITRKEFIKGSVPVIAGGQVPSGYHNVPNREGHVITVSASGAYAGHLQYFDEPIFASDCTTITGNPGKAITKFVFHVLKAKQGEIYNLQKGAGQPHVYPNDIKRLTIPLPPLEVQREIVGEIEGYQRVIDGARAVVDNWRPRIAVDPEWPVVEISECCAVKGGKRLPKGEQLSSVRTNHPYIRVTDFADQTVDLTNLRFVPENVQARIARYTISASDVYISIAGTIGLMGTIPEDLDGANLTENAARLSFDQSILDKYFLAAIGNGELVQSQIRALTHAVGVPKLALERIKTIKIPLPPLAVQQSIAAEIEAERALVSANRELVARMERRIAAAIGRVWYDGDSG